MRPGLIRPNLAQSRQDRPVQSRTGSDHPVDLRMGIVKTERCAPSGRRDRTRFAQDQIARRDVPFPTVAQGQHGVEATFGDEGEAVGQRRAIVSRDLRHPAGPVTHFVIRLGGQHLCAGQRRTVRHPDRLFVQRGTAALGGGVELGLDRQVDHGGDDPARLGDGQRMRPGVGPFDEAP